MLTNSNPFCLRTYSAEQGNCHFKVAFGQCLGLDWVHMENFPLTARIDSEAWISQGPNWALSVSDRSLHSKLWICHFHLFGSPWVVRTYRVRRERSQIEALKVCGV